MIKNYFTFLLLLLAISIHAQVVINEIDVDTPGVDDREFIELKSTVPNFSLNGYVLVFFNGTGSQANQSYFVIDLDGLTTDVNGIVLIGNQLVSPVPERIITESIFQNGPDGVGLYLGSASDFPNLSLATTANLIDALVYDTNDADATDLLAALGETVQVNEAENNLQTTQSIQRKVDGSYEVKLPTPGANNDGSGFVFNGINITVSATQITEGQNLTITFTTQTPVTSNLNFTFSLNSGSINNTDFTGSTTVFIPTGSSSFSSTVNFTDDSLDEGDEGAIVKFGSLPAIYNRINDAIQCRIIDNDFTVSNFGTPLNPTYGLVQSTAPAGYYASIEGLSGNALKQGLQDIIANPAVVRAHNYGDIVDILKVADQNPLNSNQVWLMYVEVPRAKLDYQTGSVGTGRWNREHIFPQSRGGFANGTDDTPDGINVWLPTNANDILAGHADAHHIRAEDGPENTSRSNRDYGLDYNGPTGNLGSWRGDVARALFYMAVRYNALSVVNGNPPDTTIGQMGDLATLLQWNTQDRADDFEMNRNNYIYTWQVNRNPFIDYPNLADYIWGANTGQQWFSTLSNTSYDENKVVIYPNPAKEYFTISGIKDTTKLELYNSLGSLVYTQNVSANTRIPIPFAKGIYFVKITTDDTTSINKLIVE
jgi:hypothetical protein